jgi:hypothetical protein
MKLNLTLLACTLTFCSSQSMFAADASLVFVLKEQSFFQTNSGAPALMTNLPMQFSSAVTLTSANSITNAILRLPGGSSQTLSLNSDASQLHVRASFDTTNALDAAYPNGQYYLTNFTLHEGVKTCTFNLTGNLYPYTPQFTNFAAAQSVNPSNDFVVSWYPFTGATSNDFIIVSVTTSAGDQLFRSPLPGQPGALPGTTNAAIIPANTLLPGQANQLQVRFLKVVSTDANGYAGVLAIAVYSKSTSCSLVTTGVGDTSPPFLDSSSPKFDDANVARNVVIAFTFSEPMASTYSIIWSNVSAGNFTHTWTADHLTLLSIYNGNLPANTTIGWALNPSGFSSGFHDLSGNFLPFDTYSGEFTTGSATASNDVNFYLVAKGQSFLQTNSGPPVLQSGLPFMFSSFVEPTFPFAVTNASLQIPGGAVRPFNFVQFGLGEPGYEESFPSQASLDAAYSNGVYTMNISTIHSGNHAVILNLASNGYPNTPQISNFAAAQSVHSTNDFVLSWAPMSGGTTNDFVKVQISDMFGSEIFTTPQPNDPAALNGTNTSVTIPAYTLDAGQDYQAQLLFAKALVADRASFPGVLGFGANYKQTDFDLSTVPPPLPDLAPTALSVPVTTTNMSVPISWTVINQGSDDAFPDWFDSLYISTNSVFDNSAVWIIDVDNTNALAIGDSYTNSLFLTLPVTSSGNYYIFVSVDDYGFVPESNETNNFRAAPIHITVPTAFVTTTNDAGPGSLRQAILNANATAGYDLIYFNISPGGAKTIQPQTPLPTITNPVIIDATTQPGYAGQPLIELDGSHAGAPAWGLDISAGSSTVRGLVINRFGGDGLHLSINGGNTIQGNFIGTDSTGKIPRGNSVSGINIENCSDNVIGGTTFGTGNLISANSLDGVDIDFESSVDNVIEGNLIGTDVTGTNALGNRRAGVVLFSGPYSNVIGGGDPGAGNVISGNGDSGIILTENTTEFNYIYGNYIGLDISGTTPVGNTNNGISIARGASGNTIGGSIPSDRNIISGNHSNGISIQDTNTASTLVAGNFIGTDRSGTNRLPNAGSGILINGAYNNIIGGFDSSSANTIAFNGSNSVSGTAGVRITSGFNNAISGNSIFANNGLGIDLGTAGVTPNDLGDFDSGANNLQNFPILSNATTNSAHLIVQGSLNSFPGTTYRLEFFANTSADPSNYGEGQAYLDFTNVTTDAGGNVSFTAVLPLRGGPFISATATDPDGNTSEFSASIGSSSPPAFRITSFYVSNRVAYLAWNAVAGQTYRLQYKDTLATNTWQDVQPDILANGPTASASQSLGSSLSRFYRVALVQTNSTTAPSILSIGITNNTASIAWSSIVGRTYRLQYKPSLATNAWTDITPDFPASAITTTGTNTLGGAPQRFFRVVLLP